MSVDRGFTWMEDETLALIDIYSKDDIQQELNGSKRNIGIYERIALELLNVGYKRTAYQCREKIKRLRKEYQLAKYCLQHNITPKKPMKHYDLVDKIFNNESSVHNPSDMSILNSDHEDELHFTFNHDLESDASNSCTGTDSVTPQSILPGPSSPLIDRSSSPFNSPDSPFNANNDSDDTLLLNGEQTYNCSDKDETESPWVPNVVLVENDLENGLEKSENPEIDCNTIIESEELQDFQINEQKGPVYKDIGSEEPPRKKRKKESAKKWLKEMLDQVTDNFLKYQENAESRFFDRITQIEQERMRREENMQRLWIEFEERRRKEEQQHELKMMSFLGQFICQMSANDIHDPE